MLVPLSKANELVEKIRPSLGDGKLLLSPFELKMLARDAKKLSPDNHRWCVQGMLEFLNNDVEEGIRLCELAVAFDPTVPQSWCNYAAGLRYSGLLQKEWGVINRSIEYKGILSLSYANTLAYCWADYELLNKTVNIIDAMEVSEKLGDIQGMMYGKGMVLRQSLKNAGPEVARDIRALGAIVRQLAEDERLPKLLSRVSCYEGEYAFVYQVETDDVNYLLKLDNMLFDRVIEAGIKSKNCIAFFEAASEGEE